MQEPSVFTKILNGETPGVVMYQDDLCFVILTIEPFTPGHMLVIPRQEIDNFWDLDPAVSQHLIEVARQMGEKLKKAHDYKRVGILVEGFGVPHAHLHVFGLNEGIEFTIIRRVDSKHASSQDELHAEADALNAV